MCGAGGPRRLAHTLNNPAPGKQWAQFCMFPPPSSLHNEADNGSPSLCTQSLTPMSEELALITRVKGPICWVQSYSPFFLLASDKATWGWEERWITINLFTSSTLRHTHPRPVSGSQLGHPPISSLSNVVSMGSCRCPIHTAPKYGKEPGPGKGVSICPSGQED